MIVTEDDVRNWCGQLVLPPDPAPPLETLLADVPRLESLEDLPAGTPVLVRCDTNVPVSAGAVAGGEARLASLLETLRFGLERRWLQIVHGHRGVDGRESLGSVAGRLGELLQRPIQILSDWMDDETGEVRPFIGSRISQLEPGSIIVLENARRYALETCLWRPRLASLQPLVTRLTRYVNSVRALLAAVHINEGFAASNCDLSSALVPLAMDRVALGRHVACELAGPVLDARLAEVVIFSGAKFNKLDDLASIVRQGRVRLVLAGGLLALPLLRARAESSGEFFELGRPDEVPIQWIERAAQLLSHIRERRLELLLPVDFALEDTTLAEQIPSGSAQRDIGPRTRASFSHRLLRYARERPGTVLFHNGVMGEFERPEFAAGTRGMIQTLQDVQAAGMRVYVGGGEGGTALCQFGDPAAVTHCFTAGTTILKSLGTKPIPYLWALSQAAQRISRSETRHAV